jgi:hypothetical protein
VLSNCARPRGRGRKRRTLFISLSLFLSLSHTHPGLLLPCHYTALMISYLVLVSMLTLNSFSTLGQLSFVNITEVGLYLP